MIYLLLIIFIFYIIFLISKGLKTPTNEKKNQKNQPQNHNYKKQEVKSFLIKGVEHYLNHPDESGSFIGYATLEHNKHDKYAVTIRKKNGKKIGFTPKNNKLLHTTIDKLYNGKVFCWGYTEWSNSLNEIYRNGCQVYIPLGFNQEKINMIEELFNIDLTPVSSEVKSEGIYKTIENHKHYNQLVDKINIPNQFRKNTISKFLPSLSASLLKEKKYQKLLDLETEFEVEIKEITLKSKNAFRNRIEKAREKLTS